MASTTPKQINDLVIRFCRKIVNDQMPVYVNVDPIAGAVSSECFGNVERKIKMAGGKIQYGWRLWEWPRVFIEAEFHAIWLSPDGELVDVSPFPYSKKILFLRDPNIKYAGKQINNIRQAITDDPLIHKFINVSNEIFEKQNEGDLASQHGLVSMPAHILLPLLKEKRELLEMLYAKYLGPNDLCFCNSGKKLKKCHGRR